MRRAAVWLPLLGILAGLPASASSIGDRETVRLELRGFTARPFDRSASLNASDLSDQIFDGFSVLDVGSSHAPVSSRRALNWVGGLELGSGRVIPSRGSLAITGSLVSSSHAGYVHLTQVSIGGVPVAIAPIPEPSSALLFAAGTGLVVVWLRRLRA